MIALFAERGASGEQHERRIAKEDRVNQGVAAWAILTGSFPGPWSIAVRVNAQDYPTFGHSQFGTKVTFSILSNGSTLG